MNTMKLAIIIPDGAADEPCEVLGGKTPIAAANTPQGDAIAAAGLCGAANFVPAALPPGSDVAIMNLLGYDPVEYHTGRAALEAAAAGIELGPHDWAVRCNIVTIANQIMRSFTAGQIPTEEAAELLTSLAAFIDDSRIEFHPGVSYRNLMVYRGSEDEPAPFTDETRGTPPHDLTDKSVADDHPRGPGSDLLCELMSASERVFAGHEVNQRRLAAGGTPATNVWLWGLGRQPQLPPFTEKYGLRGAMITAVDLLRGLASLIGFARIDVPGATAYLDTDYAAKGRYAVEALNDFDLVCVHIEAPDEAGHEGDAAAKAEAIGRVDEHIVGPVWEALKSHGDYRILVTPDHPTPVRTKTHSRGDTPYAMCGTGIDRLGSPKWDETTAEAQIAAWRFDPGWKLMERFVGS